MDLLEDKSQVQSFARELALKFPILLDSTGEVGARYNARAIPTTYLFDRSGLIFARAVGARQWDTLPHLFDTELRRGAGFSVAY